MIKILTGRQTDPLQEKILASAIENYQKFLELSNDSALKAEIKAKINYLKSK